MMKKMLETNIDGYRSILVLLFELAYTDAADLILSYRNTNEESGPGFSVFSVFQVTGRSESRNCKTCLSSVAHKT